MKFILVTILVICGLSNTINAYFPPYGSDRNMGFMYRPLSYEPNWESLPSTASVNYDESLEALDDNKDDYNKMVSSEEHSGNDDAEDAADNEDDGKDQVPDYAYTDGDDDGDNKGNGNQDNPDSNENTSKSTEDDDDEADKYIEDYLKIYAYASNGNNPNYDYYNIFKSGPMKLNDEIVDFNSDSDENTATSAASDESTETTPTYQTTLGWTTKDSPRGILLAKIAQSSANSDLLENEYSANIADFNMFYDHLKYSLLSMLEQADLISLEFQATAANGNDYNGQDHKKLVQNMRSILGQVDTIRSSIAEMQSIEQRLNYHLLLKALLKEIYGEKKATPAPYDEYLSSYFIHRY